MTLKTADRVTLWHRMERLTQAAIRIASEHDLDRVLQEIVESARSVIGARYAALAVMAPDGESLDAFKTSGMTTDEAERIGQPPTGLGILGLVIERQQPLRIADLSAHPAAHGFPPNHPLMGSFLGVPIIGRHGPIGHLYLTEKENAAQFSMEDEGIAVMLAGHAAVALDNARLYQERERLVTELKAMHGTRERFISMINHELRNAVTAVYGWCELWLRKAGPDAPRAAHEVYECAERTVTLLDDLLDLNRLEASGLPLVLHDTDLDVVVREAVDSVEPAALRKGARIDVTGLDGALPCRTDAKRVRQILINLLTNAVRHSPNDDVVSVEARIHDDRICIDVVDRGEGIAPELHATIFEAFERAGEEKSRGTGLGLTLSRNLARLLGGDLNVESRVSTGARFILEIPRHPADHED